MGAAAGGEGEPKSYCLMDTEIQFGKMEKVVEMNGGAGFTAV